MCSSALIVMLGVACLLPWQLIICCCQQPAQLCQLLGDEKKGCSTFSEAGFNPASLASMLVDGVMQMSDTVHLRRHTATKINNAAPEHTS